MLKLVKKGTCPHLSCFVNERCSSMHSHVIQLCSSRKNPYPPHGRSLEIPREGGGGVLEAKCLEAMYENKLEFPGGRGECKTKNLPWGEYGYFLELHISLKFILQLTKTNKWAKRMTGWLEAFNLLHLLVSEI